MVVLGAIPRLVVHLRNPEAPVRRKSGPWPGLVVGSGSVPVPRLRPNEVRDEQPIQVAGEGSTRLLACTSLRMLMGALPGDKGAFRWVCQGWR